jgi:hypothetical protein
VNIVAPFPSLAVSKELTPSSTFFRTGRSCVIHFYNSG